MISVMKIFQTRISLSQREELRILKGKVRHTGFPYRVRQRRRSA